MALKQIIEENLKNSEVRAKVKRLRGDLVVRERQTGVSTTITFGSGTVRIRNDAEDKPTAFIEAGFLELADISSGRMGPIKALLTGKIKAKGNFFILLKMSRALINRP